jgi:lysophospholipase L1-like esterase
VTCTRLSVVASRATQHGLTGPAFRADPTALSTDQFHPSPRGYVLWADALLPAVRAAVGGRLAGTTH